MSHEALLYGDFGNSYLFLGIRDSCLCSAIVWVMVLFNCEMFAFFSQFVMTAVAVALPIPAGIFFPVFLIGKLCHCTRQAGSFL